jgi:hypothetical protein
LLAAYYKAKKDLKATVGQPLRYGETSMFGAEFKADGQFCVVGPSEHQRKWYATVSMKNGLIEKVS